MATYGIIHGLTAKWQGAVNLAKKQRKIDQLTRYVDWSTKHQKWVVWSTAPETGHFGFIVAEVIGPRNMQTAV